MKEKCLRLCDKPITKGKAIATYVICIILIVGMLVGNYIANLYSELITVYLSGSGTVVTEKAKDVCLQVEEEGMVLLKNDETLPLEKGSKITLLGQDSVDFVYGGSGSGSVNTSEADNLRQALEAEGFEVNPTLWDFYESGNGKAYRKSVPDETGKGEFAVNEVPMEEYSKTELDSFSSYSDAAIVCIGRSGGESSDLPTEELSSGRKYLELDPNEEDLLKMACENFDQVIVVLNTNNAMELGFLEEDEFANVKACLWVGGVGQVGIDGVAKAISGEVNPSGHLVDTYAYDSLSAPAIANFGDYTFTNSNLDRATKYLVYGEGIYVGYRYYETRYEDVILGQGNAGDYDYATSVQFPFGYGLSYTDFTWSDYKVTVNGEDFTVEVTVTNDGSVAGKDVVQIYLQSPYTDYDKENGIEKASVVLAGFEKTSLLEPGKSETLSITVDKEQLACYDANSAKTYILDAGSYYLAAGENAHDALNNILTAKGYHESDGMTEEGNADFAFAYEVEEMDASTYSVSDETGNEITNQFQEADLCYYDGSYQYLSRSNWTETFPTTYMDGEWEASGVLLSDLEWKRDSSVVGNGTEEMPEFGQDSGLSLEDLADKTYDDAEWETLIAQLSAEQAMSLVRIGGYATLQLDSIGLPATQDKDGPAGISGTLVGGQSAISYPVEVVMASTWNRVLMEELGESIGNDSIATGVAGWYAPGVNIHRTPYSGRNFEYFSEDGYLSGQISAAEVKGARSKGVITYMKHFALNDQETNRYGASIFANEQAIREIFLKGFEYTVTLGETNAAMASMNRIGTVWSGAHKGLMTNVLREEWGFEGAVITDQASVSAMFYQDIISGLAAGTDLWLNTNKGFWKLDTYTEMDGSTYDWSQNAYVMQNVARAAKNVAYMVSGSNAIGNNEGLVSWWKLLLICLDILIYGGGTLMIIWVTVRLIRQKKRNEENARNGRNDSWAAGVNGSDNGMNGNDNGMNSANAGVNGIGFENEGENIVRKNIVIAIAVMTLILGVIAGIVGSSLVLGGKSSQGAAIVRTSIYGEIAGNDMGDNDYVEYELTLFDDDTYKMTTSIASNGYGMLIANTTVTAYGSYSLGESVDGSTPCELGEASRIIYTGYSDVGGYNMSYDTDTVAFPIELPGGAMTEKEAFWSQYGAARSIKLDDSNPSRMEMETGSNPANEKEETAGSAGEESAMDEASTESAATEADTEENASQETVSEATEAVDAEAVEVTSDDESTSMYFYSDGTYMFYFADYGIEDKGTYTYDNEKLTITNGNGASIQAEGASLKIHYVSAVNEQLVGDFTIDSSLLEK